MTEKAPIMGIFGILLSSIKEALQTKGQTGRAANTLGYQQGLFHSNGTHTLEM